MRISELGGQSPIVVPISYGIYDGEVVFAQANGRFYVNTSGTEDGFREVPEQEFRTLLDCYTPQPAMRR